VGQIIVPGDPTRIDINFDPTHRRMSGVARHGMVPFDVPFISHIEGNLWQGGCTNGLVLPKNIEHVISLYPWEQYQFTHELKSYSLNWLYDADEKPPKIVHAIAEWVAYCIADGPTLLHCQAGLNRSSLVAVLALMLDGWDARGAINLLRNQRSPAVLCNPSFENYLLEYQPVA
jgi:protein-tyrosine phosphatase